MQSNEKGLMLLSMIVLLSILCVLTFSVLQSTLLQIKLVNHAIESYQLFNAAENGIVFAERLIRQNKSNQCFKACRYQTQVLNGRVRVMVLIELLLDETSKQAQFYRIRSHAEGLIAHTNVVLRVIDVKSKNKLKRLAWFE